MVYEYKDGREGEDGLTHVLPAEKNFFSSNMLAISSCKYIRTADVSVQIALEIFMWIFHSSFALGGFT